MKVAGKLQVEELIPHRGQMLLVDEVLEREEERIVCERTFRPEEFFLDGHYPDFPIVPGVILCEVCLQTGAILLGDYVIGGGEDMVPVVVSMNNVRFRKPVFPGDTVIAECEIAERVSDVYYMKARLKRDGQMVTRLEFACKLVARD